MAVEYEEHSDSEVAQPCPTLCDPMDCSLPGFSVHGIFQARVLEWVAIAFSNEEHGDWLLDNHKMILVLYIVRNLKNVLIPLKIHRSRIL